MSQLFLDFCKNNHFLPQDSPSEAEDSRVSKLRKQRFVSAQSPTLTQPPPIGGGNGGPPKPPRTSSSYSLVDNRKLEDGGTASDGEIERGTGVNNNFSRKQPKRRESHSSRRHTLQNGIDYGLVSEKKIDKTSSSWSLKILSTVFNSVEVTITCFQLKKMKAIEEERDGLMRGLQMVQRADDWYQDQLSHVQERMRNLGKMGGGQDNPGSTEAARERLLFQNARLV